MSFLLVSQMALSIETYYYIPDNIPTVLTDPTQPNQLKLISDPDPSNIPIGINSCYSWNMGPITKDIGTNSFSWATGFAASSSNQLQSTLTDSGFQSEASTQGIYIATPRSPSLGVSGMQCGKYYGQQQAFFPWAVAPNAVLRHGITYKMPTAWHSNSGDQKYTVVMYLRVSERGATWENKMYPIKGFWLQVLLADGRPVERLFNAQGWWVLDDYLYTKEKIINIEKSNRSGLITSNGASMKHTPWSNYEYFDYTISRSQISQIVALINAQLPAESRFTTNVNDLMIYAVGSNPEVEVQQGEVAVMGAAFKNQYLRVEY